MATTYYHTVDGEIQGQTTAGVRTDYLTDALGSVVATVNSSAQVVNTYRYKPYGERLAKTGAGADPKFLWTGDTGSRKTGLAFSDQYNIGRHFGTSQGQWTCSDPRWPYEPLQYSYGLDNPVTNTDPSGLRPHLARGCQGVIPADMRTDVSQCIESFCKSLSSKKKEIEACIRRRGILNPKTMECFAKWCGSNNEIECSDSCGNRIHPIECDSYLFCFPFGVFHYTYTVMAPACGNNNCNILPNRGNNPDARIRLCNWWYTRFRRECPYNNRNDYCGSPQKTILHELLHSCAACDPSDSAHDIYDSIAYCIMGVVSCRP